MSTTTEPRSVAAPVRPLIGPSWSHRLCPPMPAGGWRGWVGPLVALVVAAVLRIPNLGRPADFAFDETYYAKDALSLLRFGSERAMRQDANDLLLASDGNPWTVAPFEAGPAYVVHPPFGKWVIAAGEAWMGVTPTGWRIGVLVAGLLAVVAVARIARRLLRSNLWGTVAGLLMAIDGLAIVMSRTAVLDNILMLCVVGAFGALLIDRDRVRRRVAEALPGGTDPSDYFRDHSPPIAAIRPWRVVAMILLGLACGVKWSGVWFVVAFGLLTIFWDLGVRRTLGVRGPWVTTLWRDALPTAVLWVAVVAVVYVSTWTGWLVTDSGYYRDWAAGQASSVVPDALRSLWHYHAEALRFHTTLTSPHSYSANAWGWPVLVRPTSFFYEEEPTCGAPRCAQEVLALGNPIIWWAAALALIHQTWRWAARRDWRAGAVLAGFLAGWLPWLMFQERTVFSFYAIAFLPFTILALTLSLSTVRGRADSSPLRNNVGIVAITAFFVLALAASAFFYPIWTAESIPYEQWNWRMWFPSWV